MPSLLRYPEWKSPAEDSAVLIWPEPKKLLSDTQENHSRLAISDVRIGDHSLADLRREMRQWLKLPNEKPVIATGHQTELYHSGVWAKLGLIDAAAKKLGGAAIHLAVDTDGPKHLQLRWPGGSWPITDDPHIASAPWSGLLNSAGEAHLTAMKADAERAASEWNFKPMLPVFFETFPSGRNLSAAIVEAQHGLDESLGLSQESILASPLWSSAPYLKLAEHLLSHADEFASAYNAALHDYRVAHRLRTDARPMPDLQVSEERCESPFWVDDLKNERRERAYVRAPEMFGH